jgi:anti-sigma B factor antagonist
VQSQFRVDVVRHGLEAQLHDISPADTELVIVDLRALEFMDSTGLSIIVRAHQRFGGEGCTLGLVRGSPQVQRLLDLTGVADRIELVAQPEELLNGR